MENLAYLIHSLCLYVVAMTRYLLVVGGSYIYVSGTYNALLLLELFVFMWKLDLEHYVVRAFAVRYSTCQTPQAVWPRGSVGQVPGSLPCSQSMHMAQSQELEAASRSSETYLAENGGLRPFNLGLASGFTKAQDRTTWRALTGTATSPTSPELWWWWYSITEDECKMPGQTDKYRSKSVVIVSTFLKPV